MKFGYKAYMYLTFVPTTLSLSQKNQSNSRRHLKIAFGSQNKDGLRWMPWRPTSKETSLSAGYLPMYDVRDVLHFGVEFRAGPTFLGRNVIKIQIVGAKFGADLILIFGINFGHVY